MELVKLSALRRFHAAT